MVIHKIIYPILFSLSFMYATAASNELNLQRCIPEDWHDSIAKLLITNGIFTNNSSKIFLPHARCANISNTNFFIGEADIGSGTWVYITFIFKVEGEKITLLDVFKRSTLKNNDANEYRINGSCVEIWNHHNELLHCYDLHSENKKNQGA